MKSSIVGLWAASVGLAAAKNCVNATVEIDVTARNGVFDKIETPLTNADAAKFILSSTKQGANGTQDALSGYATVSGRYNISAQYCRPDDAAHSGQTLQILSHGVGFDKTYWDLPYNNYNYSYVDRALAQGYHTFAFDRLGIGKSSHGEPKNEIQLFLETEALAQLTRSLRAGSLPGIHAHPEKIVHVGHSFGSAQTYSMAAMYPELSDAIVLTGFAMNSTFLPYFLAGANFQQAKIDHAISERALHCPSADYPAGYLANSDANTYEYLFFNPGNFDPGMLDYAEKTKQPVTVGEILTVGSLPAPSKFTGPVFVITGSHDLPFCGGDCVSTGGSSLSIPEMTKLAFSSNKKFQSYIQPDTAHSLNMHYNATGSQQKIFEFLESHGLAK